jgi:D-alanine transaminase
MVLAKNATIPIFDRGLLFAHSAYEVTTVYDGKLVDGPAHMERLAHTLTGLEVRLPMSAEELLAVHEILVRRNGLEEGTVYLQITGGDYGERSFTGPKHFRPRVFLFAEARPMVDARAETGVRAITLSETRWLRRDLKTTQLVSQLLAYRAAQSAEAETAIFIEAGMVTEAASANVWIVSSEGTVATRDLSPSILAGITRAAILDVAGMKVEERAFPEAELRAAKEVFVSSSGSLVLPVIEIDGAAVGDGRPGPVTRAVQRAYYAHLGADLQIAAPWAAE